MYLQQNDKARAVLFFGSEGIVRELLYSEFEALLDGFVPLEEWAGRTLKAVYVEANASFKVTSAVFFLVSFEADGAVEAAWNMPLADLARSASTGPDLGAGPIHMACKSKCPIAYYKDLLWEPDAKSKNNHFKHIMHSVKRNRLGFVFKAPDEDAAPVAGSVQFDPKYQLDIKSQLETLLQEQRSQMSQFEGDKEKAVKEIRLEYLGKIEQLQQQLQDKEKALKEVEAHALELKGTIDGQVQKIEGLREYFEHKLERAQGNEQEVVDSLKAHYEHELEEKLKAVTGELNDLLKMKEVELVYRVEHEEQLREEIDKLKQNSQELFANSGNQMLEKLSEKGVNFVTYQAGAGHITIPVDEMSNFIDNPVAFTAAYCGVSEKHYSAWLSHYQAPVCMALDEHGEECSENLKRISNPAEFIPGESEYCEKHQQFKAVNTA